MLKIFLLHLCLCSLLHAAFPKKDWTYLFYVASDEQEMDPFSRVAVRKLEQVGSDDKRWLVTHVDFYSDRDGKELVSEPAERYLIEKHQGAVVPTDYKTLVIKSPRVWASAGEANSGSPQSLEEFLSWGMAEFPADHYSLFILAHGWGWRGVAQDFNPAVEIPKKPNGMKIDYLMSSLAEFRQALESRPLDLIVMDSCDMGVLEFLYETRNLAKFAVVAPTEMPYMSFDYQRTFSRELDSVGDLARYLVTDALESFRRGGNQVHDEGDYPALTLFALDMNKMKSFWPLWKILVSALPQSNFSEFFLQQEHSSWHDLSSNVDIAELLLGIVSRTDSFMAKEAAKALLELLGEPNPRPAADSTPIEVSIGKADRIKITVEADEVISESDSLERGKMFFEYLNPHLSSIEKKYTIETVSKKRTMEVSFAVSPQATLSIRPYIAGASWARIETLSRGAVISAKTLEEPTTYYVRMDFPRVSPYLISGHTFGAGRNHGLSVYFGKNPDPNSAENNHLANGEWIEGRDYYRSLLFSRHFSWSELLFAF